MDKLLHIIMGVTFYQCCELIHVSKVVPCVLYVYVHFVQFMEVRKQTNNDGDDNNNNNINNNNNDIDCVR